MQPAPLRPAQAITLYARACMPQIPELMQLLGQA